MREFKAESKKLLDMMIHSIYTNKDIFLRELISNASDALDKRYVKDLETNPSDFDRSDYEIRLIADKEARTLTVSDSGIGMDDKDLDKNLGTIAHSGSLEFKGGSGEIGAEKTGGAGSSANAGESAGVGKSDDMAANIIGQFGVGFYSAFMVADRIEVISRAYGSDKAFKWESRGSGGYSIEETEKNTRGTDVILHLRDNTEDEVYDKYLQEYELRNLVSTYSNYIRYPITMEVTRSRRVDLPDDATEEEKKKDQENPQYEEKVEKITLNSMTPIWDKNRNELKDEDYISFYKQEHLGFEDPIDYVHMVADGTLSYRAILYIPARLPWDFYSRNFKKGLSLYSHGVKIMDHAEALLPDYYSFVQGVVSSEDFKLNLSRETLQEDRTILAISKKIENKINDMLVKMMKNDPAKYERFFAIFGSVLKAGIYQTYGAKKDSLAPLLIFNTSKGKNRNLDDIVNDLEKPANGEGPAAAGSAGDTSGHSDGGHSDCGCSDHGASAGDGKKQPIYYISGSSLDQLEKMPGLEGLKEEGKEILYLTDSIDEFTLKAMMDYKGHSFQSVQEADFDGAADGASDGASAGSTDGNPDNDKTGNKKPEDDAYGKAYAAVKDLFAGDLSEVRTGKRLKNDAAMLVTKGEISIEMEKAFANQAGPGGDIKAEKVLELNPDHPAVKKLFAYEKEGDSDNFKKYAGLLYDQARLIAGLPISDPIEFARAVQELM